MDVVQDRTVWQKYAWKKVCLIEYWIWLNGKCHRAGKNDEYILKFSTLVKI